MSNEIVDLKLNGSVEETTQPSHSEVQESEYVEGSYRYDALINTDVNNFESVSRPTLVTLFGISECGKTTFVGSLFALLRRRPELLKVTFLDSDTLTGFEKRVHLRLLSENGISELPRTRRKENSILNALLGNEYGEDPHMFLFSDLSGEIYLDAITKDDTVKKQIAVKYADRLLIFVDIEALLNDKKYMLYKSNTSTLLNRFKSNNMLPNKADIYIAFNKVDLVKKAAMEAAKTQGEDIDNEKKKAFINKWKSRRNSILQVVKGIVDITDEHVFDICAKGIQHEAEDKGLVDLLAKLLERPNMESLSVEYNWIQGLLKA